MEQAPGLDPSSAASCPVAAAAAAINVVRWIAANVLLRASQKHVHGVPKVHEVREAEKIVEGHPVHQLHEGAAATTAATMEACRRKKID